MENSLPQRHRCKVDALWSFYIRTTNYISPVLLFLLFLLFLLPFSFVYSIQSSWNEASFLLIHRRTTCVFIRARFILTFLSSFYAFPFFLFIYTYENERVVGKGKGERKFQLTSAINITVCIYSNRFTRIVYFITQTKARVRLLVLLLFKMACIGFLNFELFLAKEYIFSSFSVPRILLASKRNVPNCTNKNLCRSKHTYINTSYIHTYIA